MIIIIGLLFAAVGVFVPPLEPLIGVGALLLIGYTIAELRKEWGSQ